jgi:hypothetical protein
VTEPVETERCEAHGGGDAVSDRDSREGVMETCEEQIGCTIIDANGDVTRTPLPCLSECPKFAIGVACRPAAGDPCQTPASCVACGGARYTRHLGRGNDEIVEACPDCAPKVTP